MRKQVVGLEDDSDAATDDVKVGVEACDVDVAIEGDRAGIDRLQAIHATQQRRLARTRGADEHDRLMGFYLEVDPAKDGVLIERLPDPANRQDGRVHDVPPARRRLRDRDWIQSANRVIGIVSAMKMRAAPT